MNVRNIVCSLGGDFCHFLSFFFVISEISYWQQSLTKNTEMSKEYDMANKDVKDPS